MKTKCYTCGGSGKKKRTIKDDYYHYDKFATYDIQCPSCKGTEIKVIKLEVEGTTLIVWGR